MLDVSAVRRVQCTASKEHCKNSQKSDRSPRDNMKSIQGRWRLVDAGGTFVTNHAVQSRQRAWEVQVPERSSMHARCMTTGPLLQQVNAVDDRTGLPSCLAGDNSTSLGIGTSRISCAVTVVCPGQRYASVRLRRHRGSVRCYLALELTQSRAP